MVSIKLGVCFFFSSRRRHTRYWRDWSSDVCSSDLNCLCQTSRISLPAKVAMAMKKTGNQRLALTKKVTQKNILDRLRRRQIGTPEVEAARRRLLRLRETQRNIGFINYIMKNKCINAERHIKIRHDYHLN